MSLVAFSIWTTKVIRQLIEMKLYEKNYRFFLNLTRGLSNSKFKYYRDGFKKRFYFLETHLFYKANLRVRTGLYIFFRRIFQ